MLERRMRRQLGDSWGRLDHQRLGTWWRVWGMLKDEIALMITGALVWKEEAWAAGLKGLAERPRRRKLPPLPPAAIDLRYHCDASNRGCANCRITACYQGEPMLILARMPRSPPPGRLIGAPRLPGPGASAPRPRSPHLRLITARMPLVPTHPPGFPSRSSPHRSAIRPPRTSAIFSSRGTGCITMPNGALQRVSSTALVWRLHATTTLLR
jgi:hypothetical protein